MRSTLLILATLILSAGCSGGHQTGSSEVLVFSDNFDDGTPQGWEFRDNSGLTEERAHSGSYCLKMNDIVNGGDEAECYKIFPESIEKGRTEFWMFVPSSTTDGIQVLLTDQDSWQKYPNDRFRLYFTKSGSILFANTSDEYEDFPTPALFAFDVWNKVEISWDSTANQMRFSVNGINYGTGCNSNSGGNIRQIVFMSSSWSGVGIYGYFDDVKVYKSK